MRGRSFRHEQCGFKVFSYRGRHFRPFQDLSNFIQSLLLRLKVGPCLIRDQAHADAERAEGAIERVGPTITPQSLKTFARQARKRMRTESGGYRRDYLRALAQRVEVDAQELRIMGSKNELLRTLVAASSAKKAGFGVPSSVSKWRATVDEDGHYSFAVPLRST